MLAEIRRVLCPGGAFLYVEHGRSPEVGVARWQDRLNPVWRSLSGGCNMNRSIADAIRHGNFDPAWREEAYAEGPRVLAYFYQGRATLKASPSPS